MNKKRVAIYVIYDKNGIVDGYVTHMLQALNEVCEKLVVVCNGVLSDEGKIAIEEITSDILIRENTGFDVWGYKAGLEYVGWDSLKEYDDLILMNDSVFGPIYPINDMFEEMDLKNVDFWGITKHGMFDNFDGLTKSGLFYEHIQTYFLSFSSKMFLHTEFRKYWENLPNFKSWNEVVSFFESKFTKHFADLGFKWDVYVNTDEKFGDFADVDQMLQIAFEMIKYYKAPIMKRKNFSIEYVNFHAGSLGNNTRKAFDFIETHTEYDTDLIWEHILRTANFRNIKDNMHLNFMLPESRLVSPCVDAKVAVFAHITYDDQIEYCMNYVCSASMFADIYITTLTEQTKENILKCFTNAGCDVKNVVVLPPNSKGRDVGALWVALRPNMNDYDYICFIHNKKSPQDKPLTIGYGFAERCMGNLLAGSDYVKNVVSTFNENPRLGMLLPPPVTHGPYRYLISNFWGLNYKNTLELAEKLGVDVPIDNKIDPIFPTGGMFWFRTKALKKIIDYDLKYDDFPDEPMPVDGSLGHAFERIYCFAAQSEGYYSGWVMTEKFASTEITSLWYILTRQEHTLSGLFKKTLVEKLKKRPRLYVFLRSVYRKLKRVVRLMR